MDAVSLQDQIDAISWYHEFDFGQGLKATSAASDVEAHRRIWDFIAQQLDQVDFRGKSVLDIGCWDGYWSFEAERRGARSVLASDDFTQNWANASGILLARELLNSKVEVNLEQSVYDLASLGRTFDIILFLGVFYHLVDPFYALAQIRQCCHPGTIVLIEGAEVVGLPPRATLFDLDRPTAKWLPTPSGLEHLLQATYHEVQSRHTLTLAQGFSERLGLRWCMRFLRRALTGAREKMGLLTETFLFSRRVFLTCTPFEGINAGHFYRPPFGLHRFDPRFSEGAIADRSPIQRAS
jgi:tRNA (mo5U34)-methyltransferase